eukprot:CAMPEP_0204096206 /NCGR_PEP_ID=MMETSP0360-20130528/191819_1 /ASSEMBLY_ACC=CAM_ASM_000342 /TAXON_ID=268821 /ORGANISM="Scrippsiella Hangoei, Strain SHTV-5" /LENGTH=954 /DNA_ID=CAMNT_0051045541 /DNA_START=50 /DNA_END=2914 /DNA_ORIENTATION=-
MATSSGDLLRALVGLSILAMCISFFVEFVYFPQKNVLEAQQNAIKELEESMGSLRFEDQLLRKRLQDLEAKQSGSPLPESELESRESSPKKDNKEKRRKDKKTKSKDKGGSTTTSESSGLLDTIGAFLGARKETTTTTPTTKASPAGPVRWRADMQCGKNVAGTDGKPDATCNPEGEMPCCGVSGWCGNLDAHCTCNGCVNYRAPQAQMNLSYSQTRPKRIALIVPFRDREAHLQRFRDRINSHVDAWNQKGIRHDWTVYVVEQFDNDLFNRGYLFNVGFRGAMEHATRSGKPYDCVVMHDIDTLPEAGVDYGWCLWPNQLSGEIECCSWSAPYPDNVGGVVSLSPAHWNQINGFSNEYDGWGGEDDDLYLRLKQIRYQINGFSNEYDGWGGEDDDLYLRLKQNSLLKGGVPHMVREQEQAENPRGAPAALGRGPLQLPARRRPHASAARAQRLADVEAVERDEGGVEALERRRAHELDGPRGRPALGGLSLLPVCRFGGPHAQAAVVLGVLDTSLTEEDRVLVAPPRAAAPRARVLESERAAAKVPQGLEELRLHLSVLFPKECELSGAWLSKLSFALIDLTLGQVLLLGKGAGIGVPDSSLPPLQSAAGEGQWTKVKQDAEQQASTHMMQSQRLIRWIRKIPEHHHGLIVAIDEPLPDLRKRFVDDSRHVQVLSPLCISAANFERGKKFRATPGTQWCGDNGWNHAEFFNLMRSEDSVPKDQAVGICISVNPAKFTYRFELSETGCIGKSSGIDWVHAHTVHTSKDARGAPACIGFLQSGASTRWTMRLRAKCNSDGFTHTHSFRTMASDRYAAPLMRTCLLSSSSFASTRERRLVSGNNCDKDVSSYKSEDVWLLARRHSEKDLRLCTARGQLDGASAQQPELWRVFWNAACEKQEFVTKDSQDRKIQWTVSQDPSLFVPEDAAGAHYCLCEILTKAEGDLSGGPPQLLMV